MPDLELDDDRAAALAAVLEDAARALGAVRYGSVLQVGAAAVVLNPDSALPGGAHASTFRGTPGAVESALLALPEVFADAGRAAVHVRASPASAPELGLLCEELELEAVEEVSTLLLVAPEDLVEGEPGRRVVPLHERDEDAATGLLAEALGWPPAVARRQRRVLGHRFDDPRHVAVAASEAGELVGVATGFRHAPRGGGGGGVVGQVVEVAVREGHRGRGLGRALLSAVAAAHLQAGAELVWTSAEAGGRLERAAGHLGFAPAYDAVHYVQHL